ncbi:MAG TPA: N-acetylgalactosamine-6-sulfatase, partial [Planctomycetaceae bacterium]|nr:N-acetylgalactosamine-6-sulfatase [Planctomycetaceae bacterium]
MRLVSTFVVTLLLGYSARAVTPETQTDASGDKASKPNIVVIMADDVSWEAFGCYGGEDYRTPRLD